MESNEILTMRAIAWERAKGELKAVLHTYWPDYTSEGKKVDNGFDLASEKIYDFIRKFEDSCC